MTKCISRSFDTGLSRLEIKFYDNFLQDWEVYRKQLDEMLNILQESAKEHHTTKKVAHGELWEALIKSLLNGVVRKLCSKKTFYMIFGFNKKLILHQHTLS